MRWVLVLLLLAGILSCENKPKEIELKSPLNDWSFVRGADRFVALVHQGRQFVYFALFDPARMRYSHAAEGDRLLFNLNDGFVEVTPRASAVVIDKDEGRWSVTLHGEESVALIQRLRNSPPGTLKLEDLANDLMGRASRVDRVVQAYPYK